MLQIYRPYPMALPSINVKGQTKVTQVANLHPNAMFLAPSSYPYGFQDIAWTIFYRSKSLQQGQIKVKL